VPSLPPVSDRSCASWPLRERIPRCFHVQWRSFLRTRLCQWLSLRMMVPINSLAHRKWPFEEPDRGKWTQTKILAPCCIIPKPFCKTRASLVVARGEASWKVDLSAPFSGSIPGRKQPLRAHSGHHRLGRHNASPMRSSAQAQNPRSSTRLLRVIKPCIAYQCARALGMRVTRTDAVSNPRAHKSARPL
jgi:hypothetical protein